MNWRDRRVGTPFGERITSIDEFLEQKNRGGAIHDTHPFAVSLFDFDPLNAEYFDLTRGRSVTIWHGPRRQTDSSKAITNSELSGRLHVNFEVAHEDGWGGRREKLRPGVFRKVPSAQQDVPDAAGYLQAASDVQKRLEAHFATPVGATYWPKSEQRDPLLWFSAETGRWNVQLYYSEYKTQPPALIIAPDGAMDRVRDGQVISSARAHDTALYHALTYLIVPRAHLEQVDSLRRGGALPEATARAFSAARDRYAYIRMLSE